MNRLLGALTFLLAGVAFMVWTHEASALEAAAPTFAPPTYAPTPYRMAISTSFPQPQFPADNPLTVEGVELGRRLFYEPALSRNGRINCADCHRARDAFSDRRPMSRGVDGRVGERNAQPLFNLVWRHDYFWDGRATTLRQQITMPIKDHNEMDFTPELAAARLARDARYQPLFLSAFGNSEATSETMAKAIEQFLLTQISQDSRFDRAMRGELTLTPQEQLGLQLFFTEYSPGRGIRGADCFHCHGNALFTNERFANNGLDIRPRDTGRARVTAAAYDVGMFKVPTLRNIANTAPYMHDGRFRTLEEVVDHYDHGVQASATLDPNLAKHGGPLHLTAQEKEGLVAFLRSLSDDKFLASAQATDTQQGRGGHGRGRGPGGLQGLDGGPPTPPGPPPTRGTNANGRRGGARGARPPGRRGS